MINIYNLIYLRMGVEHGVEDKSLSKWYNVELHGGTWRFFGPNEYGLYFVEAPDGTYNDVAENGDYNTDDGDVKNVYGFPHVLERVSKWKGLVQIIEAGIRSSLVIALEGNKKSNKKIDDKSNSVGESLMNALRQQGAVTLKEETVDDERYLFSTWQEVCYKLKEHKVPLEDIFEKCNSIDSEIREDDFITWCLLVGFPKIKVGEEEYPYIKWSDLIPQLKKCGFDPEKIYNICKEVDPKFRRDDFLEKCNEYGYSKIKVEEEEYPYIKWSDLIPQLAKRGFDPEKIYEICKEIDSGISRGDFLKKCEEYGYSKIKVEGEEYLYFRWKDLIPQLKKRGFDPEKIYEACKEIDPKISRGDFGEACIVSRCFTGSQLRAFADNTPDTYYR